MTMFDGDGRHLNEFDAWHDDTDCAQCWCGQWACQHADDGTGECLVANCNCSLFVPYGDDVSVVADTPEQSDLTREATP